MNFQFQPHIKTAIQEHFQHTLPDLNFNDAVAFHVRRGDKVGDEDILHNASEYVQSFLAEVQSATTIRHCFLASDDPKVKTEMQLALKEHNVTCKLFTLLNDSKKGVTSGYDKREDTSHTMDFLYELYAMIQSKYFVGSNRSNVWKLAALFRGCRSKNDADGAILENQFHSYELTGANLKLFHNRLDKIGYVPGL